MSVTLNFDANNVKPLGDMEAIPAGEYIAAITASEAKPTTAGDGSYLALEFTVLDGDYKDRKLFTNLNIGNKNPVAVEIAYRALSSICHAVGIIQVADSAQLHNRPLAIVVKVRAAQTAAESQDGKPHDASNEIKNYKAINAAPAQAVAPVMVPPIAAAAPAMAWASPAAAAPTPAVTAPPPPPWAAAPVPAAPATPAPALAPAMAVAPAATPPWVK